MTKKREDLTSGVVKLERVRVTCPACGQQVEAMATDGRVKGYCAVAKQYVNFPIETQRGIGKNPTAKTAEISASLQKQWQDPGDGVVRAYLRGDKTIAIQLEYRVSPGVMYRILHASHVKLRTDDRKPKNNRRPWLGV